MTLAKRTLHHILRNYGHNVLLQRATADGKNFTGQLERHTVRHMEPTARLGLVQQEQFEGTVRDVDLVYYFLAEANPRDGDRIYERDERWPHRQTTWIIDYALPMRGERGQIEYWAVGATRESPS